MLGDVGGVRHARRMWAAAAVWTGVALGGAQAAVVPAPVESALGLGTGGAAAARANEGERALTDLLPAGLLSPRPTDLLLDMQPTLQDLGPLPVDPASAWITPSGLDVRLLTPAAPANPMFPDEGLSYEPPPQGARAQLKADTPQLQPQAQPADAPPNAAVPSGGAGLALNANASALHADQGLPALDRMTLAREWIADNRLLLVLGLGVAALLGAAVVAGRWKVTAKAQEERRRSRRASSGSSRASSRSRSSSA